MKSKGPLDEEKQAEFDEYKAEKAELKLRLAGSKDALKEQAASLYRALHLPMLPAEAGKILREADRLRFGPKPNWRTGPARPAPANPAS